MDVDDHIVVFLLEDIQKTAKELHRFTTDRYPDDKDLEQAVQNNVTMIQDIVRDTLAAIDERHKDIQND